MRALIAVLTVVLSSVVVLISAACIAVPVTPGGSALPVETVTLAPTAPSVVVAQTAQLTATLKDADGTILTDRLILWFTSNPGIATVSATGLVTGVAEGTATIAASSEGQTGTTLVTVTQVPVASVIISPPSSSLEVGQTAQLTATPLDAAGNGLTGRTVTWATSASSVSTVSSSGSVTAVGQGTATITATSEGKSGAASLTVTIAPAPVASVTVSPSSSSLQVGETTQLTATPRDAAGNALTGRTVTWTTSASGVATVSSSGLVTAVAQGTATITATSEGKSGSAAATVSVIPVASVTVSPSSTSLLVGQTTQLAATLRDASGNALTGRTVTWTTSASGVATVSASGLVTAVGQGTATITATSEGKSGSAAATVNPVPVASVSVSPSTANLQVGQTVQLTATPRDAAGNALTGRTVTWATSASGVATVSSSGMVTAVGQGTATITATSESMQGTATITVAAPPVPTAPATVTDLTVATVGSNSVTLSFTEVDDGSGSPAKYDIRFAPSPISWGSATHVYQGTCALPVIGTTIGAKRTCTVQGLTTSTTYQFQLVSFRGTLDVDAVFGSLSNVATGTTGSSSAPVASVTVSPASTTLGVGGTRQFTATPKDANGNTLSGRTVTWSSSNIVVATVSSGGLVAGIAPGTSSITATSEGQSGSTDVTVTLASTSLWPNEPAGLTMVRDALWDAVPPITGWSAAYNEDQLATVVTDATAPHSPPNVLQFRYPQGFVGGSAPATIYASGLDAKEYFVGMWWKPSRPWHGHSSSINKIMFFYTASRADAVVTMYGPNGGPYYVRVVTQGMPSSGSYLTQNVNVVPVVLGEWHRIELYMKYDSSYGAGDGVIRWWVNGVLVGNHTGLSFPNDAGFREFQLSPTWGGISGSKAQQDYFWYDHVYLSRR